jgi:hypothetical protein
MKHLRQRSRLQDPLQNKLSPVHILSTSRKRPYNGCMYTRFTPVAAACTPISLVALSLRICCFVLRVSFIGLMVTDLEESKLNDF